MRSLIAHLGGLIGRSLPDTTRRRRMTHSLTEAPAMVRADAPAGVVVGRHEDGVDVFRGIPFAKAPAGELRFAPPEPLERSSAPIDATRFGPISLQDIDPLSEAVPGAENLFYALDARAGEDCLNLNVWTADLDGSAPVLVYVHGGAFLCGSGTGAWIDGAAHAREHGLVVVTLNYRLGILGGLFLGDIDPQLSNLAIQDQIAALRWVRANIAAFGGDPERVTVAGESAGAMSTCSLLVAPAAKGLFARAVVQSGHLDATLTLDEARAATRTILERLNVPTDGPDVLARLRAVSLPRIAAAQREFGMSVRTFPMVLDDVTLPADPLGALRAGRSAGVDLLIGTTREEFRLFEITGWAAPSGTVEDVIAALLPTDDAPTAGALYRSVGTATGADERALQHLVLTEHGFTEPARRLAAAHSAGGGRTYHYDFSWASRALDGLVGAAHVVDIPFFFGNLGQPGVDELLGEEIHTDPQTVELARRVSSAVAQFVADGELASSALGPWRAFTADDRATMVIDRVPGIEVDHLAERLDFWEAHRDAAASPLQGIGVAE
jgi:para-nitrobenzyl esterase